MNQKAKFGELALRKLKIKKNPRTHRQIFKTYFEINLSQT